MSRSKKHLKFKPPTCLGYVQLQLGHDLTPTNKAIDQALLAIKLKYPPSFPPFLWSIENPLLSNPIPDSKAPVINNRDISSCLASFSQYLLAVHVPSSIPKDESRFLAYTLESSPGIGDPQSGSCFRSQKAEAIEIALNRTIKEFEAKSYSTVNFEGIKLTDRVDLPVLIEYFRELLPRDFMLSYSTRTLCMYATGPSSLCNEIWGNRELFDRCRNELMSWGCLPLENFRMKVNESPPFIFKRLHRAAEELPILKENIREFRDSRTKERIASNEKKKNPFPASTSHSEPPSDNHTEASSSYEEHPKSSPWKTSQSSSVQSLNDSIIAPLCKIREGIDELILVLGSSQPTPAGIRALNMVKTLQAPLNSTPFFPKETGEDIVSSGGSDDPPPGRNRGRRSSKRHRKSKGSNSPKQQPSAILQRPNPSQDSSSKEDSTSPSSHSPNANPSSQSDHPSMMEGSDDDSSKHETNLLNTIPFSQSDHPSMMEGSDDDSSKHETNLLNPSHPPPHSTTDSSVWIESDRGGSSHEPHNNYSLVSSSPSNPNQNFISDCCNDVNDVMIIGL